MFQRDRGEDGIHDQWIGSLSVRTAPAQDVPMPFAWVENP
jgi:hypothetical protein